MSAVQTEILDKISSMTVLELSELIKAMEDKFGVSAAAAVAVAAPAGGAAPAAAAEEQTEREADGDAEQADGERNPGPVDDARHHVPAQAVGAEEKQRAAFRRAQQVKNRNGYGRDGFSLYSRRSVSMLSVLTSG